MPIGWLYIIYHLLREPETAIDILVSSPPDILIGFCTTLNGRSHTNNLPGHLCPMELRPPRAKKSHTTISRTLLPIPLKKHVKAHPQAPTLHVKENGWNDDINNHIAQPHHITSSHITSDKNRTWMYHCKCFTKMLPADPSANTFNIIISTWKPS